MNANNFNSLIMRYHLTGVLKLLFIKVLNLIKIEIKFESLYALDITNVILDLPSVNHYQFRKLSMADFSRARVISPNHFNSERLEYLLKVYDRKDDAYEFFGVFQGDRLASYGMLSNEDISTNTFSIKLNNEDCYLCDAFTFPEFRGRKLHRYLTINRINYAKNKGFLRVLTIVANHNHASIQTYSKLGFKVIEKFVSYSIWGYKGTTLKYR